MYGHWDITNIGEFNPEDHYGFIYLLTDQTNNKKYIGKKSFWSHLTKKVKGKKNRKHYSKESNWKTYTSSSTHVNQAIKDGNIFKFEILSLHQTKGQWSYAEVEQLVKQDALTARDSNNDRIFYNACIPAIRYIPT